MISARTSQLITEWIQCTINSIQRMNWLSAIEWMNGMLLAASIEFIHSFHALKWNEVKFNEEARDKRYEFTQFNLNELKWMKWAGHFISHSLAYSSFIASFHSH